MRNVYHHINRGPKVKHEMKTERFCNFVFTTAYLLVSKFPTNIKIDYGGGAALPRFLRIRNKI